MICGRWLCHCTIGVVHQSILWFVIGEHHRSNWFIFFFAFTLNCYFIWFDFGCWEKAHQAQNHICFCTLCLMWNSVFDIFISMHVEAESIVICTTNQKPLSFGNRKQPVRAVFAGVSWQSFNASSHLKSTYKHKSISNIHINVFYLHSQSARHYSIISSYSKMKPNPYFSKFKQKSYFFSSRNHIGISNSKIVDRKQITTIIQLWDLIPWTST